MKGPYQTKTSWVPGIPQEKDQEEMTRQWNISRDPDVCHVIDLSWPLYMGCSTAEMAGIERVSLRQQTGTSAAPPGLGRLLLQPRLAPAEPA